MAGDKDGEEIECIDGECDKEKGDGVARRGDDCCSDENSHESVFAVLAHGRRSEQSEACQEIRNDRQLKQYSHQQREYEEQGDIRGYSDLVRYVRLHLIRTQEPICEGEYHKIVEQYPHPKQQCADGYDTHSGTLLRCIQRGCDKAVQLGYDIRRDDHKSRRQGDGEVRHELRGEFGGNKRRCVVGWGKGTPMQLPREPFHRAKDEEISP